MSRDRRNRVFVGRLPPRIEERDLEKFFRGFGKILDINLKGGFAFVVSEFDSYVLQNSDRVFFLSAVFKTN